MYKLALQIATMAHKGQFRKGKKVPYIIHPIRVANNFKTEFNKSVAVLHDVIEDTQYNAQDLLAMGIYDRIVEKVLILTKDKKEKYFDYIARVCKDQTAIAIKEADVNDNINDPGWKSPESMLKRYYKTLEILEEAKQKDRK